MQTVSVILVVRNGERYIAQALSSVALAGVTPCEILVIDGGSTDRSAAIAETFAAVRVVAQHGTGIAAAYNQAIALARGELLAFISSDDLWLPGKLREQMRWLDEHRTAQSVLCHVEHFVDPLLPPPPGARPELIDRAVPGWIMEALCARRGLFDAVGGFDERYSVSEDTDWFSRASDAGHRPHVLAQTLVRKRLHGANATLNDPMIKRNLLRLLREGIDRKRSVRTADD